jgi:hypothetical protein
MDSDSSTSSVPKVKTLGLSGADIGGSEIDMWISEAVLSELEITDEDAGQDGIMNDLLLSAEMAKEQLSFIDESQINAINPSTGSIVTFDLTRADFETLLHGRGLFERFDETLRTSLSQARTEGSTEADLVMPAAMVLKELVTVPVGFTTILNSGVESLVELLASRSGEDIKGHVLGMGGLVERQIGDALHAIIEADSQRAEEILAREREVNRMEVAVDDEATRILVKRQPAASDLRTVLALIKTVRDLERVGDEAKKIANELRNWVAKEIGPIAKPKDIRFGDNLPKTRSGKIMRRLLRSIAKGEAITQDTSTLENPAILDQLAENN